jgi:hypothetical protein
LRCTPWSTCSPQINSVTVDGTSTLDSTHNRICSSEGAPCPPGTMEVARKGAAGRSKLTFMCVPYPCRSSQDCAGNLTCTLLASPPPLVVSDWHTWPGVCYVYTA